LVGRDSANPTVWFAAESRRFRFQFTFQIRDGIVGGDHATTHGALPQGALIVEGNRDRSVQFINYFGEAERLFA